MSRFSKLLVLLLVLLALLSGCKNEREEKTLVKLAAVVPENGLARIYDDDFATVHRLSDVETRGRGIKHRPHGVVREDKVEPPDDLRAGLGVGLGVKATRLVLEELPESRIQFRYLVRCEAVCQHALQVFEGGVRNSLDNRGQNVPE